MVRGEHWTLSNSAFISQGFEVKYLLRWTWLRSFGTGEAPKAIPGAGSDVQLQILSDLLYVKDLYLLLVFRKG